MQKRAKIENTMDMDFKRIFNRELIILVIPIALQNLIAATAVSADVVMLGIVGQSAMSAVSLAGQITFVLTLFYMGMSTGAGILTAQYWGKKDIQTIQRILNTSCMFSVGISALFFAISFLFPDMLMRFFTDDIMVAANSVASVVKNLAIVLCGGIASGGAVLIGKYLGHGELEMAKRAGYKMNLYSLIFGILAGLTVLLIKPLVFNMVSLSFTAQGYLDGNALYMCLLLCC